MYSPWKTIPRESLALAEVCTLWVLSSFLTALVSGDEEWLEFKRRVEANGRFSIDEYLVVARRLEPQSHATCRELLELLAACQTASWCDLSSDIRRICSTLTNSPVPNTRDDDDAVSKSFRYVLQQQKFQFHCLLQPCESLRIYFPDYLNHVL